MDVIWLCFVRWLAGCDVFSAAQSALLIYFNFTNVFLLYRFGFYYLICFNFSFYALLLCIYCLGESGRARRRGRKKKLYIYDSNVGHTRETQYMYMYVMNQLLLLHGASLAFLVFTQMNLRHSKHFFLAIKIFFVSIYSRMFVVTANPDGRRPVLDVRRRRRRRRLFFCSRIRF